MNSNSQFFGNRLKAYDEKVEFSFKENELNPAHNNYYGPYFRILINNLEPLPIKSSFFSESKNSIKSPAIITHYKQIKSKPHKIKSFPILNGADSTFIQETIKIINERKSKVNDEISRLKRELEQKMKNKLTVSKKLKLGTEETCDDISI
jgi:hypothetical protein